MKYLCVCTDVQIVERNNAHKYTVVNAKIMIGHLEVNFAFGFGFCPFPKKRYPQHRFPRVLLFSNSSVYQSHKMLEFLYVTSPSHALSHHARVIDRHSSHR